MPNRSFRSRFSKFFQLFIKRKPQIPRKEKFRALRSFLRWFFTKPAPKSSPPGTQQKFDTKGEFADLLYEWKLFLAPLTGQKKRFRAALGSIRPRFIVLAVTLFFVALEIILQVASLAVWRSAGRDTSKRILCVGDFYARKSPAYPAQLAPLLEQWGKNQWKVMDDHAADITSKEAAAIIDHYLETTRPGLVYLMIGATDLGSKPSEDAKAERKEIHVTDPNKVSFQWRYRTGKLLQPPLDDLSYGRLRIALEPEYTSMNLRKVLTEPIASNAQKKFQPLPASEAFLDFPVDELLKASYVNKSQTFPAGRWYLDGEPIDFQKDGTLSFPGLTRWSVNGSQLRFYGKQTSNVLWQTANDQIALTYDLVPGVRLLKKQNDRDSGVTTGSPNRLLLGWMFLEQETFESAKTQLEQGRGPMMSAGLARVYGKLGRHKDEQEQIDRTMNHFRENPDQRSAEAFFYSIASQPVQEKIRWGKECLTLYPQSPLLWSTLAEYANEAGDYNLSDTAMKRAVELIPDYLKYTKARFLRLQAKLIAPRDPEEALRILILGYLQDKVRMYFQKEIFKQKDFYRSVNIENSFPESSRLTKNEELRLKVAFQETIAPETNQKLSNLEHNLLYIIQHCKMHNVPVVLISYPVYWTESNEVLTRVAGTTGADLIDLRPLSLHLYAARFAQEQKSQTETGPAMVDRLATELVLHDARRRFDSK